MDSLLANYASSDEEEEQQTRAPPPSKPISSSKASFFSSLPQPKSSSLLSSLPQPKQQPIATPPIDDNHQRQSKDSTKPSAIFSSLPQPKSQTLQQPISSDTKPKRVVQFKPPPLPPIKSDNNSSDEEDDDEENERKKRKESQNFNQNTSVKSFLSSIPAPKKSTTLGALSSNSGSGRRSIVDTEVPASRSSGFGAENQSGTDQSTNYELGSEQNADYSSNYEPVENYASYEVGTDQNVGDYANYGSYQSGIDQNVHSNDSSSYVNHESYNDYGGYDQYGSSSIVQDMAGMSGSVVRGKRGRKDIPIEVVEVKQDELMKNRPREDQVKSTGIAFGPSYQPVSTKGKPTKLHKRKHQIGSLYFDMRQKEMELAERRSKGFLTKAQTQAKYGW